jgi:hypothetical protein
VAGRSVSENLADLEFVPGPPETVIATSAGPVAK